MTEAALATFDRELQTLSKAAETLATTLPPLVPSGEADVHTLRNQVFAYTLVRMAFIHLNIKFAANDASANVRCVEAAVAMVKLFDDVDLVRLEILPPVMAVRTIIPRTEQLTELFSERVADGWSNLNPRDSPLERHRSTVVRCAPQCG